MFNCTSCGACCRRVKQVAEMFEENEDLRFPHKIDENGKCEFFENNKCNIYNERPLICNIDKMAEYLEVDKDDFYKINIQSCNKMILEDSLNEKYLIKT